MIIASADVLFRDRAYRLLYLLAVGGFLKMWVKKMDDQAGDPPPNRRRSEGGRTGRLFFSY